MYNRNARFREGTILVGKWNHNQYRIVSEISSGTTGTKHLVQKDGRLFVMKTGRNQLNFFSEVNTLKKLSQAQGEFLGPSLYDVDDWDLDGSIISFYITDYVEGEKFPGKRMLMSDIIADLLLNLEHLHQKGYCLGDLSPSNILIEKVTNKVKFIDYGGLTVFGHSVKEFTPWFDRGTWFGGARIASIEYDLFSVAMLIIYCISGMKRGSRKRFFHHSPTALYGIIDSSPKLRQIAPFLNRAITGQYGSAKQMRDEWISIRQQDVNLKQKSWVEVLFVSSLACCCFMVWLTMQ